MNVPSTVGGNWQWRATADQINDENSEFLRYYTHLYCRAETLLTDEEDVDTDE